jgi:type II secretory pathway pseudopilin PulG
LVTRACRSRGFTYLTILFVVAIMGAGLALVGEVWHTSAMREREAELLYVGNQFRKAIERYYLSGPRLYPRDLFDLLRDPRKLGIERYLRQLYPDPVTGKAEWGLVKAPDGGLMGVYSLSEGKPLKAANFRPRDAAFEGAAKYSDWKFVYAPPAAQKPQQQPGAPPPQAPSQPLQQPGAPSPR